jgi:hypothetical protein
MSDELNRLVDVLVERVADAVARKLRRGGADEYVDQNNSQLGRRRHINAIRSGELPGRQVGRQYLARQVDVDAFVAQLKPGPSSARRATDDDATDELAAELGLVRNSND